VEKRLDKRLLYCLELMFGGNDTFSPGLTRNVSHHGMLIQAENQIFPIHHPIRILLTLGNEPIYMKGIVCWNSEIFVTPPLSEKQLGVFISKPAPEYITYIDRMI
jgi:hypothetical protein